MYGDLAECLLEDDQRLLRWVARWYLEQGVGNISKDTLVGVIANGVRSIGISAVALDFLSSAGIPPEGVNIVLDVINSRSGVTGRSGQPR